jgi:predicted nucleic acid-binding protein
MDVVVADAGPLIGLARIQQLQLLRHLFKTIWITEVIAAEIGLMAAMADPHGFPGSLLLQQALDQGWLRLANNQVPDQDSYSPLNPGVDAGEASAIGYALAQRASGLSVLLLVDDRCGRAEARRQGLSILGTAAVLVLAKEHGLAASCAPLLQDLRANGYYLSDSLVAAILQQVGEAHPSG